MKTIIYLPVQDPDTSQWMPNDVKGTLILHMPDSPGCITFNPSGEGKFVVYGHNGDDSISLNETGSNIQTLIFGGAGHDEIFVSDVAKVFGGTGNDKITLSYSDDVSRGGDGFDTLIGRGGDDVLSGGADDDILFGGAGHDSLFGGAGQDVLRGQGGRDKLNGNLGNDRMFGGKGADILKGGSGNDILSGGEGFDTFVFSDRNGKNHIRDFEHAKDSILVNGGSVTEFSQLSISDVGNDAHVFFAGTTIIFEHIDSDTLTASMFDFI